MNKNNLIKKNSFILSLLIYSFSTKVLLILNNSIPFGFDHGKDSLAILDLVKNYSVKFIGPWTSIPGLFFGPGWYYLLAPGYLLTNGNPVSAAYTMILLNLVTIYLAYKFFGKIEALIIATAPAWTTISTSAWNPFPMPLLMLLMLINLKNQNLSYKNTFWIALLVSLSFHFSSAYAVFYLIVIPLILMIKSLRKEFKFSFKHLFLGFFGFLIPFMPQLIFEVRHNFLETKAVLNYFKNPPENHLYYPLREIVENTWVELSLSIYPEIVGYNKYIIYIFLLVLVIGGFRMFKRNRFKFNWEWILFIIIPVCFFPKIHFNFWYVYAILPVTVIFFTKILRNCPRLVKYFYVLLLLLTPISKLYLYETQDKLNMKIVRQGLPAKLKAIERVYELSEGESFNSYHYVPDIYDYSYQYLYFWKGINGQTLPVEFSYAPGENIYIVEKDKLLKKVKSFEEKPKYNFYIVEFVKNDVFLGSWWDKQRFKEIIYEEKVGRDLVIYKAVI